MKLFFGYLLFLFSTFVCLTEQWQDISNNYRKDEKRSNPYNVVRSPFKNDFYSKNGRQSNDFKYEKAKQKFDFRSDKSQKYSNNVNKEGKSRNDGKTVGEYGKVAKEITKVAPILGFGSIFHDFFDIFYEKNQTKQREKVVKKSAEYIFSFIGSYAGAVIKAGIYAGIGTIVGKLLGERFKSYFFKHAHSD